MNIGKWPKITKKLLKKKYIKENKNPHIIAQEIGCHYATIIIYLRKFNIELKPRYKNLEGLRFGKYLVIKFIKRIKYRSYWLCRCDCGTEKIICGTTLTEGKATKCMRCRRVYYGEIHCRYLHHIKGKARYKGIEFDVSMDYLWKLFLIQDRRCAISGVPLFFADNYRVARVKQTASLDRIDSSKGYTKRNVQWVHRRVNTMKMELPQKEFIGWCKKVARNN